MDTKRIVVDPDHPNRELLREAASIIRNGGLVAFPTETVYGLGANALDPEACRQIYVVKGRPQDNPLIVHVASREMVDELVSTWSEQAERCARKFWPGPLTLVLPKSDKIADAVTGGLKTVALRMPAHPVALALIEEAGVPIAAPSANLSGKPSPTKAEHVWQDMNTRIPIVIDGGASTVGLESTVLDLTSGVPVILRPGGITREQLEEVLGPVELDRSAPDTQPKAPGMKYRHYAPEGEMVLVRGSRQKVIDKITALLAAARTEQKRTAVLCTRESEPFFVHQEPDLLIVLGSRREPQTVAAALFDALRRCDEQNMDLILAEGIDEWGLGLAILNRLEKAAGHKVIFAD